MSGEKKENKDIDSRLELDSKLNVELVCKYEFQMGM